MLYGFAGAVLHVNLTTGELQVEHPDEQTYRTYLGGSALALSYLLRECPAGADPLGPDNVLVFAISAPTGFPISGQSRATVVARSPLTGAVGDAQAGGFWPAELKFAGFDAVVIKGRSEHPVYLWIHDGEAELRDASHLWGMETGPAEDRIREELGDNDIEVAQIGPAGEKLVRFAAIMTMANRAFGRTGLGAVMGAKNLKAVAVRGRRKPVAADSAALLALAKEGAKGIDDNPAVKGLGKYGTANIVGYQNAIGGQPTYNYRTGVFPEADKMTGERMYETILKDRDTCYACAVRCKRVVEVIDGPYPVSPRYGGPEYETISTFGSYCGVSDLAAIAKANELCARYGADTISAGATIAWAMECFEQGLITTQETGGIELRFGDAGAMLAMLEHLLRREGLGDVLAEGSVRAAERLGRGHEYLIAVKGQEIPAHMPQVKRSMALIYAANPFGADHQSSEHDNSYTPKSGKRDLSRMARLGLTNPQDRTALNEEKVRFTLTTQYTFSALDSISVCQFVFGPGWQLYGPEDTARLMRAVTGWDITVEELQEVGARRLNLLRAFNAREGIGRDRDTLPKRLFKKLEEGRSAGLAVDEEELARALDAYYTMAGWDRVTGMPTRERLEELWLGWVADTLQL